MKSFNSIAKWLSAGVLALAISVPAGAAAAASGTAVPYEVFVLNPGAGFDWNALLRQYYGFYPIASKPAAQPAAPASTGTATAAKSSYASQVIELVNRERAKAGLKALTPNAKLSNMALVKAKDMKNNHYFSHQSPTYGSPFDMMDRFGIAYRYAGENIAMGQPTPQAVMKDWMNSPGHKANILNKNYTQIGVAYYNGEWVQEFIG